MQVIDYLKKAVENGASDIFFLAGSPATAKVEGRIQELEEMLKNVKVISDDQISTDTVNIGAKVVVLNTNKNAEIEYTIVGSTEAAPLQHKISDLSPIGKALIGHKVGETVKVTTPAGETVLEILSIAK